MKKILIVLLVLILATPAFPQVFGGNFSGKGRFLKINVSSDLILGGNLYMADDNWMGLGSSAGRIVFDNQTTDEVNIMNANVGIGTAAPKRKLHVIGNVAIGDTTTGDNDYTIYFATDGNDAGEYIQWNDGNSRFQVSDDMYLVGGGLITGAASHFLGSIGVETTSPDAKVDFNLGTDGKFQLSYNDANGSAADKAVFDLEADGLLSLTTTDADAAEADICLMPDGLVGIATLDPAKKLHVMGDVALGDTLSATEDRVLYFGTDGSVDTEYLMWDESETMFYFSDSLTADGYIDYCTAFNSVPGERAIDKLMQIKGKSSNGGFVELDHSTLPEGIYIKQRDGKEARNLSNMVSFLATAIQDLKKENEELSRQLLIQKNATRALNKDLKSLGRR